MGINKLRFFDPIDPFVMRDEPGQPPAPILPPPPARRRVNIITPETGFFMATGVLGVSMLYASQLGIFSHDLGESRNLSIGIVGTVIAALSSYGIMAR